MDCYPPCKTCTGLCTQTPLRPVRSPATSSGRVASIPHKHGWTVLKCGHKVSADEQTLTVLGDGLGAQPFCDRCGDFRPIKKSKKTKRTTQVMEPLF